MDATHDDKAEAMHVETIASLNPSGERDPQRHNSESSANEEIIRHLQTTGEDVGMTFNTLMAAVSM